jgi:hypothetical protein
MPLSVSITQQDIYAALGAFVASVVPTGVKIVQLPVDRAAMPAPVPGFVGMTANLQTRIMTNLDRWSPGDPAPSAIDIEQAVKLTVKLDCYGAAAADWAVMLSTVLRDEYGVTALAPTLAPLYTEMPRFMPLTNAEEQYEQRWIVEAYLQYNPVISTPMQFADAASADLINVDVSYPP